jgi:hypothetical protein
MRPERGALPVLVNVMCDDELVERDERQRTTRSVDGEQSTPAPLAYSCLSPPGSVPERQHSP